MTTIEHLVTQLKTTWGVTNTYKINKIIKAAEKLSKDGKLEAFVRPRYGSEEDFNKPMKITLPDGDYTYYMFRINNNLLYITTKGIWDELKHN